MAKPKKSVTAPTTVEAEAPPAIILASAPKVSRRKEKAATSQVATTAISSSPTVVPEDIKKKPKRKPTSTLKNPPSPPKSPPPMVVTEEPPKPIIIETSLSADKLLVARGFVPLAKLISDGKVVYIKVVTVKGELALVHLDKKDLTSVNEKEDVVYTKNDPSIVIPATVKSGYGRCVNPSIAGLALESQGQVCTINRSGAPLETPDIVFVISDKKSSPRSAMIMSTWGILAYPVVRISEIEEDEEAVLMNIHENTNEIHAYARKMNENNAHEMIQSIALYPQYIDEFTQLMNEVLYRMDQTLDDLNEYDDNYRDMEDEMDEPTIQMYKTVVQNLRAYNEMYNKIIQYGNMVTSTTVFSRFNEMLANLKEAHDYLLAISPIIGDVLVE